MSCNCNGICTQACVKGAVEPEEMVIKFENRSGVQFKIMWCRLDEVWDIYSMLSPKRSRVIASFKLLEQAEKCAEALKESV